MERQAAELAKQTIEGQVIHGTVIEIEWSKPPINKKQREQILRDRESRLAEQNLIPAEQKL